MARLNRTYSSPSLNTRPAKGQQRGESHARGKFGCLYDERAAADEDFYVIGDRVYVDGFKAASVAYFGEVEFAAGDWVGLVLDNPLGNHNGKVHGREYFQCAPFHGLFVRPHRVCRMPDSALGHSSAGSSRAQTPAAAHSWLPSRPGSADSRQLASYGNSPAASSAITDSYFYDEDYRQSGGGGGGGGAAIASLNQRIRDIEDGGRAPSRPSSAIGGSSSASRSPVGILKKTAATQWAGQPAARARSESRQPNAPGAYDNDPRLPVFNFRPRRAKLDDDDDDDDDSDAGRNHHPNHRHEAERPSRWHQQAPQPAVLADVSNRATVIDLRSSEPPRCGDRVWVQSGERAGAELAGVLRYLGQTNFATGEWAGVELDQPEGKNDGSVLGCRYFDCSHGYGLFVPATRVRKQQPGFKAMRSTIKSPPPPRQASLAHHDSIISPIDSGDASSSAGSRSMTPASHHSYSHYSSDGPPTTPDWSEQTLSTFVGTTSRPNQQTDARWAPELDRRPKFDDRDIEFQLIRSLNQSMSNKLSPAHITGVSGSTTATARPRCIKYTFSTSRYDDGNPIARRTVEYD